VAPYQEKYPAGSMVRLAALAKLEEQRESWKYHHPITDAHLLQAGRLARVKGVAFYHGGDPLYTLENIPSILCHEFSLEAIE